MKKVRGALRAMKAQVLLGGPGTRPPEIFSIFSINFGTQRSFLGGLSPPAFEVRGARAPPPPAPVVLTAMQHSKETKMLIKVIFRND